MTRWLRLSLMTLAIGATIASFSFVAEAKQVKGKIVASTEGQLADFCSKNGGTFYPSQGGSDYSCVKDNCDGKGGFCGVECSQGAKECDTTHPTLQANSRHHTALDILRGAANQSQAWPGGGMRNNIDLAGFDFQRFGTRSPAECQTACMRARNCKAWTYVRPGVQGRFAVCRLKNAVPRATSNSCCVSGVKN